MLSCAVVLRVNCCGVCVCVLRALLCFVVCVVALCCFALCNIVLYYVVCLLCVCVIVVCCVALVLFLLFCVDMCRCGGVRCAPMCAACCV